MSFQRSLYNISKNVLRSNARTRLLMCKLHLASNVFNDSPEITSPDLQADTKNTRLNMRKNKDGPDFDYFLNNISTNLSKKNVKKVSHPFINTFDLNGEGRKVHFIIHGCQMNVSDSDIAWAILKKHGYNLTSNLSEADIIFIMTCSIREKAEDKIFNKLKLLNRNKKNRCKPLILGVLGCMAERLREKLIDTNHADLVAGPDSYKDLPRLLAINRGGETAINVLLSHDETYADVIPVSINHENNISAYVSIIRGCNNMCSFCIVPFTRGNERSRAASSIMKEVKHLSEKGIKEITLLGQNVNSYKDCSDPKYLTSKSSIAKDFKTIYKLKDGGLRFADLLEKVSAIDPEMRIRFTSPHPKDFPDAVLQVIKERHNICKHLHLPSQCGSTRILKLMRRGYSRDAYLQLVEHIRSVLPSVSLTSDIICGFCTETEEEFEETLSLMEEVKYDSCYIFQYSMREKTHAHRTLIDDVPLEVKNDRLTRLSSTFRKISLKLKQAQRGQRQLVLIEGPSKRSELNLCGRNDKNCMVILPKMSLQSCVTGDIRTPVPGDYVEVVINEASSLVLFGIPLSITTMKNFYDSTYPDMQLVAA